MSDRDENKLIETVLHSADEELRCSAMNELTVSYIGSNNKRVGNVIAQVVCDESLSIVTRTFAYCVLLDISSKPKTKYPNLATFQFPADLNWNIIDEFLTKRRNEVLRSIAGIVRHLWMSG